MGILALLFGCFGGLCAVMGIITAAKVIPDLLPAEFTAIFWLALSAVLLLACIAAVLSRTGYE